MADHETLWCERGGADGRLLVLLHGLGANGAVWDGLRQILEKEWPGRWMIPDLRGHGRSFRRAPYGIGIHAGDVAALLRQDEEVTLIGHSMGGVIALALATGLFGVQVKRVFAFGVKVDWSEEELARIQTIARTPSKLFATRAEAIERHLRVSGLKGLVDAESASAEVGIRESNGGYVLATDPQAYAIGRPDFVRLARAATSPIDLLCGETDTVANPESMRRLGGDVTVLHGLGHSPHVEAPGALWQALMQAGIRT